MAIDRQGIIYVTTGSAGMSRLFKFSPDRGKWEEWGAWQRSARPVNLWGVAVDMQGNVYAADAANHCIEKLSPTGELLACLKADAHYLALDAQGHIYLSVGNRVEEVSATGKLLADWGGRGAAIGQFNGPMGIAVDTSDNVYVADAGNDRIQELLIKR